MTIKINFVRMSAPSFKALAIAKLGRPVRGQFPTTKVIVAQDAQGRSWQHFKIFQCDEINTGIDLMRKIDGAGVINPTHWRLTQGEY